MWNCPKCNEASEDNFDSCWKCGAGRGGEPAPADRVEESPAQTSATPKTNWPLFFGILLSPAVLTALVVASGMVALWILIPIITLFGSLGSGMFCAKLLVGDSGDGEKSKSADSLALSFLFFITSFGFCYAGCSVLTR